MHTLRRQDLLQSRQEVSSHKQEPADLDVGAVDSLERRLNRSFVRFRHQPSELLTTLRSLEPTQRFAGWLVTLRTFGPRRGNQLFQEALGTGFAPMLAPRPAPAPLTAQGLLRYAKAQALAELAQPLAALADGHTLWTALLAQNEPAGARTAQALARTPNPPGGKDLPTHHPGSLAPLRAVLGRRAGRIYRHQAPGATAADPEHSSVQEALRQLGQGEALPGPVRLRMEKRLGIDLAAVRVHRDTVAAAAAQTLQARAFTLGQDIFFAAGAFEPESQEGQELLVHELTHVVQAYQGRIAQGDALAVSHPSDPLEQEAHAAAKGASPIAPTHRPAPSLPPPVQLLRSPSSQGESEEEEEQRQQRRKRSKRRPQPAPRPKEQGTDKAAAAQRPATAPRDATNPAASGLAAQEAVLAQARTRDERAGDTDRGPAPREPQGGAGDKDSAVASAAAPPATAAAGAGQAQEGPRGQSAEHSESPAGAPRTADTPTAAAAPEEAGPAPARGPAGAAPPPAGGEAAAPTGAVAAASAAPATAAGAKGGGKATKAGAGEERPAAAAARGERPAAAAAGEERTAAAAQDAPTPGGAVSEGGGSAQQQRGDQPDAARDSAALTTQAVAFAEPAMDRLVPPQPGEAPEARQARVAQARQKISVERAQASAQVGAFLAEQEQQINTLATLTPQAEKTLGTAERSAAAHITQAATAQRSALRAEVARALAQAQSVAATARAQINGAYTATVRAIDDSTRQTRAQLDAAHRSALAATRSAEARQLGEVGRLYGQADRAFHAAAAAAGSYATGVAAGRAEQYLAGKINREDSFLDGHLTDNRCEAQAEAARKVGQAYREELAKEGDKQVQALQQRRPTDDAAVRQVAEQARRSLETAHQQSLRALEQDRQRGLAAARRTRDAALTGTATTLQQTRTSLQRHEQGQVSAIARQAQAQRQGLQQQRQQAVSSIRSAVQRSMTAVQKGLKGAVAALNGTEVPEAEALSATLAQAGAALAQNIAQARQNLGRAQQQSAQALEQGGARAALALAQTGAAATAAARATGSGAAQALAQGGQAAAAALAQAGAQHRQQAAAAAAAAAQGRAAQVTGMQSAYQQLSQRLQQGMQHNADAVRRGLMEVVDRDMGATITTEAEKARAQVKPRWQSVLRWVIIIAIVLVVAIVLGPMVIGAVTGLAAGLGASAAVAGAVGAVVGGAIVGAGTAAVTTVVDNAFAGRSGWALFDGVGTAMAWGALGGALGGGASAVLAGPMQGMTALARYGVQVGVDTVMNTGLSLAQGNLTLESFGSGLLMSMVVNGVAAHPRVRLASEGAMSRGYGAGFEGGVGLRGRLGGAAPPGPASISPAQLDHVARGDSASPTSPNAGNWTVKGGGHVPGEIIPRADGEGVPHSPRANDPVTGVSIERFTRPSGATTDKSLFPPGTTRAHVDTMASQGLGRALSGAPGSSFTPPPAPTATNPNPNGTFRATVRAPNGHPIVIEGFYRPNGAGGFEIASVFPSTNLPAGTIPVVGGTGLGGSRTVPIPGYAYPHGPPVSEENEHGPR